MCRAWSGLCVAVSVNLLVTLAGRDAGNSTVQVVEVHTSSFVAIESQGKMRKNGNEKKVDVDRNIGEVHKEIVGIDAVQSPGYNASVFGDRFGPSKRIHENADIVNGATPLPPKSVQQAIQALIASSDRQMHIARRQVSQEVGLGDEQAPLTDSEKTQQNRDFLMRSRMLSRPKETVVKEQLHKLLNPVAADGVADTASSSVNQTPVSAALEGDMVPEIVLTSSTETPNQAIQELESHSTSILSVVFFTYLLLGLTALAAFVACMTQTRTEECSREVDEQDKWWRVLRYGSFGETPHQSMQPAPACAHTVSWERS